MTRPASIFLLASSALAIAAPARADMAKLLQQMANHTLCCGSLAGTASNHLSPNVVAQVASGPVGGAPAPAAPSLPATAADKPAVGKPVAGDAKAAPARDFERVGFELLAAYNYQPPSYDAVAPAQKAAPPKPSDQIPDYVRKLDKKKIAVTGFMLPTKFKDGRVTEFLLMKDQSGCCFGAMPRINEWIIVKMSNGGVPPLMDVPLTFVGTLKVGEVFEEGYLSGLYQLDGEKMLETAS